MNFNKITIIFLTTLVISSCNTNQKGSPKNIDLDHISLSGNYQTIFTQNDKFNYDGLIVTAFFSDSSSKEVNGYTVISPDMSTLGEHEVLVTYDTCFTSYSITIEEEEEYEGYMFLTTYQLDIALNDGDKHYLNPGIRDKNGNFVDVGDFPFRFELSNPNIISITRAAGIYSNKTTTGTCVVTCIYTENENITAKCTVNVLEELPVKEKVWKQLNDYDSLKEGDIITLAAPDYNFVAGLDFKNSKMNVLDCRFSSDKSTIITLPVEMAEFYVGVESHNGEDCFTLEAQTGEYLICTHQGKVKLDKSTKTNRFWDIHSNVDPETGEGSLSDGAVIENYVLSLGYFLYNVSLSYFTTYVENSLRPRVMELPFIYRLEEK